MAFLNNKQSPKITAGVNLPRKPRLDEIEDFFEKTHTTLKGMTGTVVLIGGFILALFGALLASILLVGLFRIM